MTTQQARDQSAREWARAHKNKGSDQALVLQQIAMFANDQQHLHLTPHFVTSARELGIVSFR